jgi:hypothetical protein
MKSLYVQQPASRMQGVTRKTYLYCNWSGVVHQSKEKIIERLRYKVHVKRIEYCTAYMYMTVTEYTITKKVKVPYCNHHSGNHNTEICHLRVPEETKNVIAAKLAEGVSILTKYLMILETM